MERERAQQDRVSREPAVQATTSSTAGGARSPGAPRLWEPLGPSIRDEEFRARFGSEHRFRVEPREDRRFRYGGYWFVYTEPWPRDWDYEDDFYIDDIDGEYYLIDPVHPGYRIRIIAQD